MSRVCARVCVCVCVCVYVCSLFHSLCCGCYVVKEASRVVLKHDAVRGRDYCLVAEKLWTPLYNWYLFLSFDPCSMSLHA